MQAQLLYISDQSQALAARDRSSKHWSGLWASNCVGDGSEFGSKLEKEPNAVACG